jgi:hypothetical protein
LGVLAAAIVGKLAGADGFEAYPTVELGLDAWAVGLAALVVLSGLTPWRRRG